MEIRVNPTRMELNRLKRRLAMAQRGHKLLKDKRDELMRKFLVLVRKNKELREEVEERLAGAFRKFMLARAVMSAEAIEEAILYPKERLEVKVEHQNVMSVHTPKLTWEKVSRETESIYPYGFAETSAELDDSISTLAELLPRLLELAEVEKAVMLLAAEIERTRRRVNALEYVMIPRLASTIRYITMKLDENERGSLTRLMKVKDIVRAKSV
ncbi:MAG: V/A-type H+/Na+-transporting ATPase subunit [Bacillota bacterium]|jgi:V/A-type H+-transporting ATPase subunit D|nr:V/A-type H+/Na+-transporting ATPase subunit [Bacillota bacterium]MDK2959939.1 V/A-type H+/Na+-transporting ATPase subunit [Bacillota bacterium]